VSERGAKSPVSSIKGCIAPKVAEKYWNGAENCENFDIL